MRKAILITLGAVAAFVLLPFVAMLGFEAVDSVRGGCSDGEIRVFGEFPHYGGRQLEPKYNSGAGGCYVAYTTEDRPEAVLTYYRQQLTDRGWELEPLPPPVESAEGQTEGGTLDAARDGYGYEVLHEWPTKNGTSVVVYVIERED